MTAQPQLCPACLAEILALAVQSARPEIAKLCTHNGVMAFGHKRGTQEIQSWELYGPASNLEIGHRFAERIAESLIERRLET